MQQNSNSAKNIIELSVSTSIHLKHGSGGSVNAAETVYVPPGYVGILSVRRSYGNNKLFVTSQFLEGGFRGQPELHFLNMGNDLDLMIDKAVVNLVIVKGLNG